MSANDTIILQSLEDVDVINNWSGIICVPIHKTLYQIFKTNNLFIYLIIINCMLPI